MYDEHTRDFFFHDFFLQKKKPIYVHRTYTKFYPTLTKCSGRLPTGFLFYFMSKKDYFIGKMFGIW